PFWVPSHCGWQDFHGDLPAESGVEGAVYSAHSTFADDSFDSVGTQLGSGHEWSDRRIGNFALAFPCGTIQEISSRLVREHLHDRVPDFGAGLREQCGAFRL